MKRQLQISIEKALKSIGINNPVFKLDYPDNVEHGDFSCNAAMVYAKQLKVVPKDLQSTFVSIADNSIISKEFAQKIAPVVGLRNRIVHQYEDVDPKLFIASVRKNIGDFDHYIAFILTYIGGLKK
jgi:uncharacterized protein YutE (UPF0331/DUF86 family)